MADAPERDPVTLLRLAERERAGRGKLKIFFGMAAGVGKTYAMLQDARRKRQDGLDVVVAYLESHQRSETEELAVGIEAMPRRRLEYRGRTFEEMDLDAVIARRPSLALVDELAHTDTPGSRNRKRYQDVLELLEKGIDVSATMNVQHLESIADTVEGIAGITISERVPDSVFDGADQVVLIDLSPEELLRRLGEGKVYAADMATAARENFFKRSTLTALREMALRQTALLVNHQLADMAPAAGEGAPKSGNRLLVAVSASPNSAHLIRWTRQRAFGLKAEWTALSVETGRPLSRSAQETLQKNVNLARQLGGEVVTVPSDDVAEAVIRYARAHAVTEIVVGKAGSAAAAPLPRRTITERIVRMSGGIDVTIVQEKGRSLVREKVRLSTYLRPERASLAKAALTIGAVTAAGWLALPAIGYRSVSILYLLAVIALAFAVSRTAVLLSAVLSAVLWDLFFIPPRFTFSIGKLEDMLMFFLYFVTAAALAYLMSRLRANRSMLALRERRLSLQHEYSQEISAQRTPADIVRTALRYAARYFEAEVVIFLKGEGDALDPTPHSNVEAAVDEKELGVARWCFEAKTPCGLYTDTLHMARCHYIPLLTQDRVVGVFGIRLPEGRAWMTDHEESLQMLARTAALCLERETLAEENRRNLMVRESERLGKILLHTVSHELRTPLTTIKGSITALMDPSTGEDREARGILLDETLSAVDRLNGVVENILSMSRLESGMLRLKKSPVDAVDLTSVVADALRRQTSDHPFTVRLDGDLPPITLDFVLMAQVLANLVQNAVHHTPAGTPIELSVERAGRGVRITVADAGPGVSAEDLPHLFETFFRARGAAAGGVGLGLSICKGIVEAHGGKIAAFRNRTGGLSVSVEIPMEAP
jgi:two-component system, OmpR family, sensor histidine kinase KdpD